MMQYRPELGSIGLTLQRYPGSSLKRDRDYFTDTANSQQTTSLTNNNSYYSNSNNSRRQALEDNNNNNQRTTTTTTITYNNNTNIHYAAAAAATVVKARDQCSPVSTLSPPESAAPCSFRGWSSAASYNQSEGSSGSDASSSEADFHGRGGAAAAAFHHRAGAEAAAMRSPVSSFSAAAAAAAAVQKQTSCYQMATTATAFEPRNHHHSFVAAAATAAAGKQQYLLQQQQQAARCGNPKSYGSGAEMSGDVVQMLQVLESALLDDDDDEDMNGGSFHHQAAATAAAVAGCDHHLSASEGSWADAFVDILGAAESTTPAMELTTPMPENLLPAMILSSSSSSSSAAAGGSAPPPPQPSAYAKQQQKAPTKGGAVGYVGLDAAASKTVVVTEPQPVKSLLETGRLEQLLVACAEAVAENDFQKANAVILKLNQTVSIHGDPMQRLAAYMVEGLVARMVSLGGGLYKALKCKEEAPAAAGGGDLLSAMQVLYDVCPYFKFGYMAANGAIVEAFQNEDQVHIIDFEINQGVQWSTLIQALAARAGGPPHLRITGVDDPSSEMMRPGGGLKAVGNRLRKLAQSVGVPFVFHAVEKKCPEVQAWMLERQHGEALAVNFALQLHHVPDESVCTTNPRDRMLQMVKGLDPKVVTLVEQEANTNTAPFLPRFVEAMKYYSAVFQSLDVTLGRDSRERINVEQQCLARDLVNVIACEGAERVERHEMLGKWRARMTMAGFRPCSLSASMNNTIKLLLEAYSDKYRLKDEGGALSLGWMNRSLIVASAWH